MWIRSQNKECLVDCKALDLGEFAKKSKILDVSNDICLGEYETEERAIEILDNIQIHMQSGVSKVSYFYAADIDGNKLLDSTETTYFIYQMPEK